MIKEPTEKRSNQGQSASRTGFLVNFVRALAFFLFFKPLILLIIGFNIRNRQRLPSAGPAILAANHNSHLDTIALMSIYPFHKLHKVRPVAAADYWLRGPLISWFARNVIGIIPVDRTGGQDDPLQTSVEALANGEILIFFPEGSRGEPEQMSRFKTGLARVVERYPETEVYPIFMHGMGKTMPKGSSLIVPFWGFVSVGQPLKWGGSRGNFLRSYTKKMNQLAEESNFPVWSDD